MSSDKEQRYTRVNSRDSLDNPSGPPSDGKQGSSNKKHHLPRRNTDKNAAKPEANGDSKWYHTAGAVIAAPFAWLGGKWENLGGDEQWGEHSEQWKMDHP
ncbi:MAG: hypothetical protein Q9159_002768 [Coniocarpon cinnabarinum]